MKQFRGMFIKRLIYALRNKLLSIAQLLIPVVFVILALHSAPRATPRDNLPPLALDLGQYPDAIVSFATPVNPFPAVTSLADAYAKELKSFPSVTSVYVNAQNGFASNPNIGAYLADMAKEKESEYIDRYMIALDVENVGDSAVVVTAYFNAEALHSIAVSLNAFDTALFKYLTNRSDASIATTNSPLMWTDRQKMANGLPSEDSPDFPYLQSLCIIGMAFLMATFSVFLIQERAVKAKHCQFASGARAFTFWLSTFFWDYISYLVACIGVLVVFLAFDLEPFVGNGRWGIVLLLLLLYGWAMLPIVYLTSFLFTVPASGLVALTIANLVSGGIL